MSFESLEALAVCHAPQLDGLVMRPSDKLPRIRRAEADAGDATTVAFQRRLARA